MDIKFILLRLTTYALAFFVLISYILELIRRYNEFKKENEKGKKSIKRLILSFLWPTACTIAIYFIDKNLFLIFFELPADICSLFK